MGKKIKVHQFCAKSMPKNDLFGIYSADTSEFIDGIFVRILREALVELNSHSQDNIWIVFEGDIDPNWAENLNSALDDNRLFTLPTGERFLLPINLKIIFESENLENASMASISRMGLLNHEITKDEKNELINGKLEIIHKNSRFSHLPHHKIQKVFEDLKIDVFFGMTSIIFGKIALNWHAVDQKIEKDKVTESNKVEFFCNKKTSTLLIL